jgi:hypothetical protein
VSFNPGDRVVGAAQVRAASADSLQAGRGVVDRRSTITAEPTAAWTPASSCGMRSNWQRSVARCRSYGAPKSSFSPPARARGTSPYAASSHLRPASGALPSWRLKDQQTVKSRKHFSSHRRRLKSTSQAPTGSSGSARAGSFPPRSPNRPVPPSSPSTLHLSRVAAAQSTI